MIDVDPKLAPAWGIYDRWGTLCVAGRCLYADLGAGQASPPWRGRNADEECPGYAGFLHVVEHEPQCIRVRSCDRRRTWEKKRRAFVLDGRKQAREREKALKS